MKLERKTTTQQQKQLTEIFIARFQQGIEMSNISAIPPTLDNRLKHQYSLHRLFSYPNDFEKKYFIDPQQLAEAGLYFSTDKLVCFFCNYEISLNNLSEWKKLDAINILEKINRPECTLTTENSPNVPIGNIDVNLNYKFEAHRLYSLLKKKDWKFVNARDLAKSGFYYTKDDDNCRCVFCNLEVRGWEEGDTADGEHHRWNPNCPFLKDPTSSVSDVPIGQEQTQVDCLNVPQSGSRPTSINPFAPWNELSKYHRCLKLKVLQYILNASRLNIFSWLQPKYRQYSSSTSRITSYKNWPPSLEQTPVELSRSGFYYTGLSDKVICYHCGLGLKDWALGDEPASLHAKWNSACPFLLMSKGPQFVDDSLHSKKSERKSQGVVARNSAASNLSCRKCEMHQVAKVSLPCGHAQLCQHCDEDFCFACQEKIVGEVSIYF